MPEEGTFNPVHMSLRVFQAFVTEKEYINKFLQFGYILRWYFYVSK